MDDQDGLNNFADEILTEQDRFKNHSKDWKSSLTIDHPSIQVVFAYLKYLHAEPLKHKTFRKAAVYERIHFL